MKLNAIMLLTFLLSLTSCSILGSNSGESDIIGEWEWIKSTGGFAGHTVTPDSTGFSEQQLLFSINNKFSFYRADTMVASGRYSLSKQSGSIMIKYNTARGPHLPDQWIDRNQKDTLVLRDRCADCYTSIYKRD